jgi:hypothetical protein
MNLSPINEPFFNLIGPSVKVKRAEKQIFDLNDILTNRIYKGTPLYSLFPKVDYETGKNVLQPDITSGAQVATALMIGEIVHNLKSALDISWYIAVDHFTKQTDSHTRFPVADTWKKLIDRINGGLKKKPNSSTLVDFLLNDIKPYEAGNVAIWGLHDLNIRDKHQLLIPVFQMLSIDGVRVENDKGVSLDLGTIILHDNRDIPVRLPGKITVKEQGNPTLLVFFGNDMPFKGEAIIPTLEWVAQDVTRTIKAIFVLCGLPQIGW